MRTVRASPVVCENSKSMAGVYENIKSITQRYMRTARASRGVYENSKSITQRYMRTVRASPRGI